MCVCVCVCVCGCVCVCVCACVRARAGFMISMYADAPFENIQMVSQF